VADASPFEQTQTIAFVVAHVDDLGSFDVAHAVTASETKVGEDVVESGACEYDCAGRQTKRTMTSATDGGALPGPGCPSFSSSLHVRLINMSTTGSVVKVYAARRWSWWRIGATWVIALAVLGFVSFGSYQGFLDPNLFRAWTNDNAARAVNLVALAVVYPYLLLLISLVTLQAIGRVPVLVLFTRGGVRHVASWLGWHRLSPHRMALPKTGALQVFTMQADPFKRQLVQVRCAGKMTRVQSYGVISDEDLAVVDAWVRGEAPSGSQVFPRGTTIRP